MCQQSLFMSEFSLIVHPQDTESRSPLSTIAHPQSAPPAPRTSPERRITSA